VVGEPTRASGRMATTRRRRTRPCGLTSRHTRRSASIWSASTSRWSRAVGESRRAHAHTHTTRRQAQELLEPLRVNLSANLPPCARATTISLRAFIPHACFCFALVCLLWFACFGWDLLGTRTRTPWAYSSGRIFPPRTARRPLAQRCETTSILACLGMSIYVSVPSPTQHDSSPRPLNTRLLTTQGLRSPFPLFLHRLTRSPNHPFPPRER